MVKRVSTRYVTLILGFTWTIAPKGSAAAIWPLNTALPMPTVGHGFMEGPGLGIVSSPGRTGDMEKTGKKRHQRSKGRVFVRWAPVQI